MSQQDSHNKGGLIAFVFSMVFCLAFFIYISVVHPGVDLKEIPSADKTQQIQAGAPGAVDVSKVDKPWVPNDQMVAHGKQVFAANCAVCHGNEGKGDGPAGKSLVPPPRNLVEGKWKVGGDSIALYKTIKNGIQGTSMAGFGHLPKVDRWALVQFIHSITQNKVKDDDGKLNQFGPTAD